jgi:hypothetical protein
MKVDFFRHDGITVDQSRYLSQWQSDDRSVIRCPILLAPCAGAVGMCFDGSRGTGMNAIHQAWSDLESQHGSTRMAADYALGQREVTRDWRHRTACVAPIGRVEMRYGKPPEKLLDACSVGAPADWMCRRRRATKWATSEPNRVP